MSIDEIRRRFAAHGRLEYDDGKYLLDQNRRYANTIATTVRQVQAIIDRTIQTARIPRRLGDLRAEHIGQRIAIGRLGERLATVEFVRHMDGDTCFSADVVPLSSDTKCEVVG